MSRPWRIQYEDAVYHVISRGNNRQAIFLCDEDRLDFLRLLGECCERFELLVHAFCLMDNHYHLFLTTPRANLSAAMHWLNTSCTVRHNLRHGRGGHVLQGRFKSVLVVEDSHWAHLSMYLHLNPVRAGMVETPGDYKWSSFPDYTSGQARFKWLRHEQILEQFGDKHFFRRRNYARECLQFIGKEPEVWKDFAQAAILGTRQAINELLKRYAPKGAKDELTEYKELSRPEINTEAEIKKIAAIFGVSPEQMKGRKYNSSARLAAYLHLVTNCGLKPTSVAAHFGVCAAAVTMGIKRLQEKINTDRALRNKIAKMLNVKV